MCIFAERPLGYKSDVSSVGKNNILWGFRKQPIYVSSPEYDSFSFCLIVYMCKIIYRKGVRLQDYQWAGAWLCL